MLLYRSKAISTYKELGVEELQWPAEDERELSQEIIRVNPLNRHSILQVNTQFMNKHLHNMDYLIISSYFIAIFLAMLRGKLPFPAIQLTSFGDDLLQDCLFIPFFEWNAAYCLLISGQSHRLEIDSSVLLPRRKKSSERSYRAYQLPPGQILIMRLVSRQIVE